MPKSKSVRLLLHFTDVCMTSIVISFNCLDFYIFLRLFFKIYFRNVLCGQLQCLDKRDKPVVDFGKNYTKKTLDSGEQCR